MSLDDTILRFRQNLPLYAAACLLIRDKDAKTHHLEFWQPQKIVHEKIERQLAETGRVRAIILKARQEGVSTYVASRFFRDIHLWPNISALVVADELARAETLYSIYDRFYENLPPRLKPEKKARRAGEIIAFKTNSELKVRPASDKKAGRAGTIHRLHASEIAFWGVDARETWTSVMQGVPAKGSEVIIESTAKGAGGLFHEEWEKAENDEDSQWLAIFLPWWALDEYSYEPDDFLRDLILDDPDDFERVALTEGIPWDGVNHILPIEKLAWRRMVIAENFGGSLVRPGRDAVRNFQQEFPATAEEAFLVSGSCFFDEDRLRELTHGYEEPLYRGTLVERDDAVVEVKPLARGAFRCWELPSADGHYVVGCDTAEGVLRTTKADEHSRDYSAATVVRLAWKDVEGILHPPKVVAEVHGWLAPELFAAQIRLLGRMYSCGGGNTARQEALVGVERNHSSGQTVLRLLREHYRYPRLYWQREVNRLTKRIGRRVGWITDGVTRMPMLDDFGQLIRDQQIDIPSRDLVREMVTFVLDDTGRPQAEESCHDDRVMSTGIAIQMMAEHRHSYTGPMPQYAPDPDTQTG